jgi:hypothetical protein
VAEVTQCRSRQLENMVDGLYLGAIYLAYSRSLSVAILAHGVADTLDVLLLFSGSTLLYGSPPRCRFRGDGS